MTATALLNYWLGIPAFLIGIPATCVVIYAWCAFARTPKGRR